MGRNFHIVTNDRQRTRPCGKMPTPLCTLESGSTCPPARRVPSGRFHRACRCSRTTDSGSGEWDNGVEWGVAGSRSLPLRGSDTSPCGQSPSTILIPFCIPYPVCLPYACCNGQDSPLPYLYYYITQTTPIWKTNPHLHITACLPFVTPPAVSSARPASAPSPSGSWTGGRGRLPRPSHGRHGG